MPSTKRHSDSDGELPLPKKRKTGKESKSVPKVYNRIASLDNATTANKNPPVAQLQNALKSAKAPDTLEPGACVVYWMRMGDLRINDNRAISHASEFAKSKDVPLIVFFVFSPQDYTAHDRGARRIDFTLRNLKLIQVQLDRLGVPLFTLSHSPRRTLPQKILELLEQWDAKHLFANAEYEVDEARRDLQVLQLARENHVYCYFSADKCLVEPNAIHTKQGKPFAVYSPWMRAANAYINQHPETLAEATPVEGNPPKTRTESKFFELFAPHHEIPTFIPGFELSVEDRDVMTELFPAGTEAARQMLHAFIHTKARKTQMAAPPLNPGAKAGEATGMDGSSRLGKYHHERDLADRDSSSRLSPYLAAGVISARELVREATKATNSKKMVIGKDSGIGVWVQEIGWRDFYTHTLAAFPSVSMGRPFQEKFQDVKWESNEAPFEAWKEGKTGYPIVDAAMRQLKCHGWVHNRTRMIVAMFLVKDLMIDWRLGEQHFHQYLLDADLASNNGGWQWCASTGVDPQPYFRIFNPALQSVKTDPEGDYIRHFVPELKGLCGKSVHEPYKHLSEKEFLKLGYPKPIVDHVEARARALRRYKNPGEE